MTSLPKNNNKCRTFPKPNKIYFIRMVLMRAIQKCTLLNLSHYVKSYGHFCQILAIFTMLANQIWSCHVTQEPNFEIFLFCPDSIFNIGEITKFLVETFSSSNFIRQEHYEGMENTPPRAFRVNIVYLAKVQEGNEEHAELCAEWSTKQSSK